MMVQRLIGPSSLSAALIGPHDLSVLSYNVMLPNSVDGWWMYKMYNHPLDPQITSWEYRSKLIQEKISQVDPMVVCFQEVAPDSFEQDFEFMKDLGYTGKEMFKKGRFRPATFWKPDQLELAALPVHKDRTLLTAFKSVEKTKETRIWYVLNCHLQAGPEAPRRVRQIHEGLRAVLTLARKLKEDDPQSSLPVVVCGDFNGGSECGAVRYLEDGFVDETFVEDGAPVSSGRKELPLSQPMVDVMSTVTDREPPATMVVSELISTMTDGDSKQAYSNPNFSETMLQRLQKLFCRLSSETNEKGEPIMTIKDIEDWLIKINGQVGRGSEFREALQQMTGIDRESQKASQETLDEEPRPKTLPPTGYLTCEGFVQVYLKEMRQGKFWGIAYDMAVLGEPLPNAGTYQARYDRLYCSRAAVPVALVDFVSTAPCPNEKEPSDHLPVAAAFRLS